jgi:hypothetical protein
MVESRLKDRNEHSYSIKWSKCKGIKILKAKEKKLQRNKYDTLYQPRQQI